MINTKFWSDGFIVELNPLDRYLFLYLLTNEHTNICGIYELPWSVMARETGLDIEMLQKMFKRLKDKVCFIDNWIYIKNFSKHQKYNESVKIGIEKAKKCIPENILAKISKIKQTEPVGGQTATIGGVFKPEPEPEPEPEPKPEFKSKPEILSPVGDEVEIIPNLLKDKQKHIQIIGLYARAKNIIFTSKENQQSFIKRNLKASSDLKSYDIQRVVDTIIYLVQNADFKWTLESVGKYIDENLDNLNKRKILNLDNI